MDSADVDLYFARQNTARPTRRRYRYQDECVALRCIANLESEEVKAVVVEWSADYVALLADGTREIVSVKHRDPGQGEWTIGSLTKEVLPELFRVWREMSGECLCAFASNAAVRSNARTAISENLARYIGADERTAERFGRVLSWPDPPLPRWTEITAVGIRAMAGALSLLDRDPRYAEECYHAVLTRIEAVAVEMPDSPERRIAKLSGSMRAVAERGSPRQSEQTLRIADLREVVLTTEAVCARRAPTRIKAAVARMTAETPEVRVGSDRLVLLGEAEVVDGPDGSYRTLRSAVRRTTDNARELWLTRLEIARDTPAAARAREALAAEARLHTAIPSLPRVVAQERTALVTQLPGAPVDELYGPAPYPGIVLDHFLSGLRAVARTLAALHDTGLAHRALRPAVLLASRENIWLRDSGLAVIEAAGGEGPYGYRAPEQERPLLMPPGPATDVYQLAAVVFHVATGQLPGSSPPPPSLVREDLAPELDAVLLAALAIDPGRRSVLNELMAGFAAVLRGGGVVR